jgi:hypothetical protein
MVSLSHLAAQNHCEASYYAESSTVERRLDLEEHLCLLS